MNKRIEWYLILACTIVTLSGCRTVSTSAAVPSTRTPTAAPPITTPLPPPTPTPTTSTASLECGQDETGEIIWPHLDQVNPIRVGPGGEISVTGSRGYVRCNSGYNESARTFQVHFDGQPAGWMTCHANHCKRTLTIPANAQPGMHTISVEGGAEISIEIAADLLSPRLDASTPERSMPQEADLIQGRLTAAGLDQVQVSVTGFQKCPCIPTADEPGWIDIDVTVSDTADPELFGEIIDIVQASTTEWPEALIHLSIFDTSMTLLAWLEFTNQDVQILQAAGHEGAELYEALLESSQD